MNIILLVTVCQQNKVRIQNQIANIQSAKIPEGINIKPIFVVGKNNIQLDLQIPYNILQVDVEEKYLLLYKKLFESFRIINNNHDFDFILKIDDDTILNFERLNPLWLREKDYIGKMAKGQSKFRISFDFDFYDVHKVINLVPPIFENDYFFATGDCYFLSKKAIEFILKDEQTIQSVNGLRVCEDRLFGYILQKSDIVLEDIIFNNEMIHYNGLQTSKDLFSIHPIHENLFQFLIGKTPEEQLQIICQNPLLTIVRRKTYIKDLENKLIETIYNFMNSKKSIGLG